MTKNMHSFPISTDDITTELLTDVLREHRPGLVVESFQLANTELCGDGFASTADQVVLDLKYAEGSAPDMPGRVMLKTMLVSPHAPKAMYLNEVRFYHDIRPHIELETPQCYASLFDPQNGQFGIIMDDLNVKGASFPKATQALNLQQISGLVKTLARLHAQFWNSSCLKNEFSWIPTPCSGGMFDIFSKFGLGIITEQIRKHPFKQSLIDPIGLNLDQMWQIMWEVERHFEVYQPRTILHGDSHIGNTYLLPDGSGGLLDWQLIVMGCWAHDLAYLIVTGLETEFRQRHERDLIALYLEELKRRGVTDIPSKNEAWLLYRKAIIWGLVIGWLITPPENYGIDITKANISRLVNAVQDLESFNAS